MWIIDSLIILLSDATVKDSLSAGYRTILLDDCSRGIDAKDIEKTKSLTIENHGVVINSSQVCDVILRNLFTWFSNIITLGMWYICRGNYYKALKYLTFSSSFRCFVLEKKSNFSIISNISCKFFEISSNKKKIINSTCVFFSFKTREHNFIFYLFNELATPSFF